MRPMISVLCAVLFMSGAVFCGEEGLTGIKAPAKLVLVDTDWLERNLNSDKFRLIEVSSDPALYDKEHIPGAVKLDWKNDLLDSAKVQSDEPNIEVYKKLCKRLGISNVTPLIFYGDANNMYTAYAYWAFVTFSHAAPMKILDGGRKKWEAEKRPLTADLPKLPESADFHLEGTDQAVRANLAEVTSVVKQKLPGFIVDSRSPAAFAGKVTAPDAAELPRQELKFARAGNIRSATNVPVSEVYLDDGTFKSEVLLKAIFEKAGILDTAPVYTYDWTHVNSAHHWFVLKMVLNYSDVRMYNGGWYEYSNGTEPIGPVQPAPKPDVPKP